MRRFASAVILFLGLLPAGILQAQTCPPPVVMMVGGTNPACAGQTVTLDAGPGWVTYQWSPGGATTRMISDSPSATMSYSVTTTDANGCSVTSQPMTVVVNAAPAAPSIQLRETTLCGGAQGEATVAGTWTSYAWSVTHGTIASGPSGPAANGATVDYTADGNGPITVSVTVTDSNGCAVTASADVTLRAIAKPVVQTYPDALCPGSHGRAYINAPAEGGSWQSYHWTIVNGTISLGWSDSSESLDFLSDASGQAVSVQVTATDTFGCSATSDRVTIPVRAIAKPVVQTYPDALCPGSHGRAFVNAPAEGGSWQSYHWTIVNGTISQGWSDSSESLDFISSTSSQPVTVQITATDTFGCSATSDPVTIPVRAIAKPVVQTYPDALCPGSHGRAFVNAPAEGGSWQSYHWTIVNGTISQGWSDSSESLDFISSTGGQPVSVQVTATDTFGCSATSNPVTIPVRAIAKPVVQTYPAALCPGSHGRAFVNAPAEGGSWQSYHWTIVNGTISQGWSDSSESLDFISSPDGQQVSVQVTATDTFGCSATASVDIPVSNSTPAINVDTPPNCAGSSAQVSLAPPSDPSATWQSIQWSVTGGTILDGDTSSVMHLQTDPAGGTAVVTVSAQTSQGCSGTASTTLTTTAITPSLSTGPTSICAGAWAEVDVNDNWLSFQSFNWTVTHATINGISTNPYVIFTADGTGDVTATLTAVTVSGCTGTSSVTYRLGGPDATITAPASDSFCVGSQSTASVPDAGSFATYQWTLNGSQLYGATARTLYFTPSTTSVQLGVTVSLNGCSSSGSKSLTALAAPQATLSAPSHVCYLSTGNAVTLSDPGPGVTIEWQTNPTSLRTTPTADPHVAHFDSVPYQYFNGSGAISVKLTNASGCVSYVVASVDVDVPRASASPGGPTTFCQGGSVTIYGNPIGTGYSYLWSNGATTANINATQSGSYSVTVTDPAGCSLTSTGVNVTVTTPAAPAITASGPTTFCAGGSVTLTAPGGFTYSWSNGATTQAATVGASGNYSVTVTGANGCSATSAATAVTVNPVPTPVITGGPICGGFGNLTTSAADSYRWSTGDTSQSINIYQAGTYSVTVTVNGCSATSPPYTVQSFPASPTLAISGRTLYCPGETATLSAQGGEAFASLKWTITNGTINGPDNGISVNFTTGGAGPARLAVLGTEANGCLAGAVMDMTVANATATIVTNGTACSFGASAFLQGSYPQGTTFQWSVTNAQINGSSTLSSITFAPLADGPVTLSVTVTEPGGCGASATRTVTGSMFPAITATIPASVCTTTGNNASVSDAGPNATYRWTAWADARITSDPSQRNVTFSIDPSLGNGYGWVSVTATKTDGSCTETHNQQVHLDAFTVDLRNDGPSTICPGGTAHLYTLPWEYQAPATYLWSTGATTTYLDAGPGTYTLTVTDGYGCSRTSSPITITALTPPAPTLTVSPAQYCSTTVLVNASVTNASSYTSFWFRSNGFVQTMNGGTAVVTPDQSKNSFWIAVDATDASGCTMTSQVNVPLIASPVATITVPDIVCEGNDYVASVPDAGPGATYDWHVLGAAITSGTGTSRIHLTPYIINPSNPTVDLAIDVTNAGGCTKSGIHDITIHPSPQASITLSAPAPLCDGTLYTATTPDAGPGASYRWTVGNGMLVSGSTSNTITFYPMRNPGFPTYIDVYVTGTNGCTTHAYAAPAVNPTPATRIDASGPTEFCQGGSVTLTAATSPDIVSYRWSNGATTTSITVTQSGAYDVTVMNAYGCSSHPGAVTVTVDVPADGSMTASGPTTFCAGGSVTLTANDANVGAFYQWSTGATTRSITVTQSGIYTLRVSGGNACSWSSSAATVNVLAVPATPAVTASGPTTFCAGGSVTLTAPSGYTYSWSTGATTQSITVNAIGTYGVTVTNASGCSATSAATSVAVNANPPTPTITASGPTTFCVGGSVTLSAPAGYSYSWSTGATTQSIAVSSGGSYTVTVVDATGCSATSSSTAVTVNANPTATIAASGPTTLCAGGSVTLTASAGASYLWSTGATTQAITVNAAGNYSVAVTSAAGCMTTSAPAAVTSSTLSTTTSASATTICDGQPAILTANVTGGSAPYSYQWSNGAGPIAGATAQSYAATVTQGYYVTVTDAGGCSVSTANTPNYVNVNPSPLSYIVVPNNFCSGGTYSVGTPDGSFASYSWSVTNGTIQSTNRNTAVIVAGTSGSVTVQLTVTNSSGCPWTGSQVVPIVSPPPVPVITASGPTSFCQGGQVTLTAPAGYSYTWHLGSYVYDTAQSITVGDISFSGSFTVTVTNAGGCSTTSAPTVVSVNANPDTPVITAGGPTTFCAGGSVTLTAPASTSYLWSTGATTQSITVNSGGSYGVTVTNASGCSAVASPVAVTVNANPTATITAGGPTTFCAGGSVTLTASSGASYLWSTGATTQSIAASASGNYSVTVTGANGCSTTSSPTAVTVNAIPTATITAGGPTTFCAGGSVTLTASSGTSYLWSTGATTQSIIVNASGSYSVTVTASGCSAVSTPVVVTVNANPATPVITAGGPTTFCAGGSVTLTAPASPAYLWSNGATTQSINASTSGNYTVTITDANGCKATSAPTAVTANALPSPSIVVNGALTYCQFTPATTLNASPATGTWYRNGVAVSTSAGISASDFGTGTGSFVWRATNAAGCTKDSDAVVVTINPTPDNRVGFGFLCWNGTSDAQSFETSPGTTYQWSVTNGTILSGAGTSRITYAAAPNATTVGIDWTVTSAAGCPTIPATLHFDVQVQVLPTSISAGGPTTFCAGNSVVLTAATVPGAAAYIWSNGASGQSLTVTASGSYSVHVVNGSNGCVGQESAPVSVTVQPLPAATITAGGPTTFCSGGSVTLTASSGASYLWSTGATTQSITATTTGSYSVTVTGANGCAATSAPAAVTVNARPSATITAGGPTTFCTGGSVTLTASTGASYLWSTGATTNSITVSAGGSYNVTVTNASGCSATSSPTTVTVNANPTATITASGPTTYCIGGSVTLTASSGASYWWSNGQTTPSITISDSFSYSGSYSVTVTNANGCSTTSSPMTVTSLAGPTPGISYGQTTFCAGGSVTLTASGGTSYLWSTGATTTSIVVTSSGSYSAVVTDANGCSATTVSVPVTVNANPTPTITAGGPTTFCPGGSVTLTASSGASYLWSTGATTQAIAASASGNYSVTVTNANGCSATSSPTTVTVNANPPTPTITAGGPTTFCSGGSVTLTSSSGTSYLWSTGATTQAISATTSGSYTVTVSNANGCHTTSAPTVVTVKTLPTAVVSGGGAICPGASATITATLTGTAPWSVKWSDNNTQQIASGTTATRSVNPSSTTTYTVTSLTDASSCAAVAGSGSATVTRLAAASITTQPANKSTTVNTSVTLTVVAAGSSPVSYQWFNNSGTIITGATSSSYTTSFPSKGNYKFYVEVWNTCNATHVKSSTVTVTVN